MLIVVTSAVITYNAARNKTVFQSSVHIDKYGTYPPELVNDGNRGSRCAYSNVSTYPWWAVDLGSPTAVYRVDLTNIFDDKNGMNL